MSNKETFLDQAEVLSSQVFSIFFENNGPVFQTIIEGVFLNTIETTIDVMTKEEANLLFCLKNPTFNKKELRAIKKFGKKVCLKFFPIINSKFEIWNKKEMTRLIKESINGLNLAMDARCIGGN